MSNMPRSLRIFCIFGIFLLVLIAISEIPKTVAYAGREFISGAVDHLLVVVTAVLVGAILLWIIEESIEHHIAPAIDSGLKNMAAQVAGEVRQFPDHFKNIRQVQAEEKASIQTPAVKELVSEGKLDEAAQKAKSAEEQVAVLLQSQHENDWRRAMDIARNELPSSFKYYLHVSFRLWQAGHLEEALKLSEEGLAKAQRAKSGSDALRIQNSLAYYYADSKDAKYEKLAREYATNGRNILPDVPEILDTDGFVKITFGRTREEVLEGVALCEKAKDLGSPFDGYAKAIARAQERLKDLNT